MASTSFKKKKYGMVRPVKPAKVIQPKKPSVLTLKAIFKTIDTASNGLHLDALSHALYWWQAALPYIKSKMEKETLKSTKLMLSACEWMVKGQKAGDNKEKERCFVSSLDAFRSWAKNIIATPPVTPHLKEMRKHNVGLKDTTKRLDKRFSKLTILLAQCFASTPFEFKVVPHCHSLTTKTPINMRYDHSLKVLYLSKSLAGMYVRALRTEGLLPVAIESAYHIARAMAFVGMNEGKFVIDAELHLIQYRNLLKDMADFAASNPNAPNRLVKKTFTKPKRERKKKDNPLAYTPPDAVGREDEEKVKRKIVIPEMTAKEKASIGNSKWAQGLLKKKPTTMADLHKED